MPIHIKGPSYIQTTDFKGMISQFAYQMVCVTKNNADNCKKDRRCSMEVCHDTPRVVSHLRRRATRHRRVIYLVAFVLILPMVLSPTRPVAVYGYLVATYVPGLFFPDPAAETGELNRFLVSPEQVLRYQTELRDDLVDTRSGHLFAIVRGDDGHLRHAPIRTWNSFLPRSLPDGLSAWLDRKELPYLGDTVDLWVHGNTVVAMGHYHPFGGGPSDGDHRAQLLSTYAEVVVSNGVVPMVFVDGEVVSYTESVDVSDDVFRSIRALEPGLLMEVREMDITFEEPSPYMASFLGYLERYREVELSDKNIVADAVQVLVSEFKDDYGLVFSDGFSPERYQIDVDKYTMLRHLQVVEMWASSMGYYQRLARKRMVAFESKAL